MKHDFDEMIDMFNERIREANAAFDEFFYGLSPESFEESNKYELMRRAFEMGKRHCEYNQWISCDKYLPPYEVSVLVRLVDAITGEYVGETFRHRSKDPECVTDKYGWAIVAPEFNITHWCFIPIFTEEN